jgi:hypothetical protein
MSADINDKHLALIQGAVNRLAGNSFSLKGWSVTLVSALLALAAKDAAPGLVAIALLPAITFWGLDGYFLAQERLFRRLYAKVIDAPQSVPPFSMKTDDFTGAEWAAAAFSLTMRLFHGTILATVFGALLWSATR